MKVYEKNLKNDCDGFLKSNFKDLKMKFVEFSEISLKNSI